MAVFSKIRNGTDLAVAGGITLAGLCVIAPFLFKKKWDEFSKTLDECLAATGPDGMGMYVHKHGLPPRVEEHEFKRAG